MTISIIIPNYNGVDLLRKNFPRLLDKIHKSKDAKIKIQEIIIVDDKSTDESVVIMQEAIRQVRKDSEKKFTVKLSNRQVGENFIVFMLVKGGTTEYIDNKILGNEHVKEVFGVTGEYDLLIKLKFENVEEFHEFVLNFRKGKKEIQSTLTMVVTANLKEEIS